MNQETYRQISMVKSCHTYVLLGDLNKRTMMQHMAQIMAGCNWSPISSRTLSLITMPKQPMKATPQTPRTMADGIGLPKSNFHKKDQWDSNEAAIQAIAVTLAPPRSPAQPCPCRLGGTCYGHISIYTGQSAGVFSLDDPCTVNFASWQQRVSDPIHRCFSN